MSEEAEASYRLLRRIVGALGMGLPAIMVVWGLLLCGCLTVQPSISAYYGTCARDGFVGILFTIASFLLTYRAYKGEDVAPGILAGSSALVVALSPVTGTRWQSHVHDIAAGVLFLVLAYFCLCLFRRSRGSVTVEKAQRNRVYTWCGWTIIACVVLAAAYQGARLVSHGRVTALLGAWKPVLVLETLALAAFGFSWLVKGETWWKDRAKPIAAPPSEGDLR